MNGWDTNLPSLMHELHLLEFDYDDGEGIDFIPYLDFSSQKETSDWFRVWTGNQEADGKELRIFGQDATGGLAAFWLVELAKPYLEQPIVFLGSEGQCGLVAYNFYHYLWLLAAGFGPFEAVVLSDTKRNPIRRFMHFADKNSMVSELTPPEILEKANIAYPNFTDWIQSLCR